MKYNIDELIIETPELKYQLVKELSSSGTPEWYTPHKFGYALRRIGFTIQEYFDLVVLGITDPKDRPKCHNEECNNYVRFSGRFLYGYSVTLPWKYTNHVFCCRRCAAYYQQTHLEEFPGVAKGRDNFINARYNYKNKVYTDYKSALTLKGRSPNDPAVFYIAIINNSIKIGISESIESRIYSYGNICKSIHLLLSSDRTTVYNLEALIKLDNEGSEYFNDVESAIKLIRKHINNIYNPFE